MHAKDLFVGAGRRKEEEAAIAKFVYLLQKWSMHWNILVSWLDTQKDTRSWWVITSKEHGRRDVVNSSEEDILLELCACLDSRNEKPFRKRREIEVGVSEPNVIFGEDSAIKSIIRANCWTLFSQWIRFAKAKLVAKMWTFKAKKFTARLPQISYLFKGLNTREYACRILVFSSSKQ